MRWRSNKASPGPASATASVSGSALVRDSRHADRLSLASFVISALALLASAMSTWTANRSLDFAHRTNLQTQRTSAFMTFQSQFFVVTERFPAQYLQPDFRPVDGSSEYARLEAFWLLIFSEWYATHRVDEESLGNLWAEYFAPLVADGLAIPSLRHVLENLITTGKLSRGGWNDFLRETARIARAAGEPLSPEAERRLGTAN